MADYIREGVGRGRAIGNRGPVCLDDNGKLHPEILDAFREHGFYIFENVIDPDEIRELRADIDHLLEHAPVGRDAGVDARGRKAFGQEFICCPMLYVCQAVIGPMGWYEWFLQLGGRHQSKMTEAIPDPGAPRR